MDLIGETALGFAPVIKSGSRGEKEPIASNDTTQGRAQNRWVEIEVTDHAKP